MLSLVASFLRIGGPCVAGRWELALKPDVCGLTGIRIHNSGAFLRSSEIITVAESHHRQVVLNYVKPSRIRKTNAQILQLLSI
jgi:hypothetical protein